MASSWSRSLGIGSYGSQMKVTVRVLSQNRSANTSRVKVTIQAYNGGGSRAYNQGSGATVSVSGNGISHSAQVKFSISGRSWFTFADWDFTVSHNANGTLPVNIVGRIADTGTSSLGSGGGVRVQGTADPLYLAPTAPSFGSTAYQNPGRVRVSWSNRSTARGSYDRVRVQRWARSTGKWYHRALLSGSATSYTDTDLSPNNEHRWRVRAEGPGGTSGWVQGGTLGTTPAAATGVRAVKAKQGVRVSWTDNAAPTNRSRTFLIDDNPGGTGWVRVGSIGGSATSWTHTDADPAVTHQYRVRARITSGIDHTSAASGPSGVLQLQAAPKQPGRVAPLDILTLEVGDTLPLEWQHNPVDTTEQTEAELQWRVEGGDWNTVQITGDQNIYEVTPNPSGARARVEWRVRTRGEHPDWSPWSTTNGPLLSTRPMVLIQAPAHGEDLTTSRVEAAWTYEAGGTEPQLQQAEWVAHLSLYDSGTVVENQSGSTASSAELQTRLQNSTRYALSITVRNGDGLWSSPDASVFTTDFPLPAVVQVFPEWDHDAGAVSLGFGESEELRASYRWTGDPGASTSEAVSPDGETVRVNHATYPVALGDEFAEFSPGTGGEYEVSWLTGTGDGPAAGPSEYGRAVAVTPAPTGSGGWQTTAASRRYPVSGAAGQKVTLSAFVRYTGDADAMRCTLRVYAYDGSTQVGMVNVAHTFPSGEWVRASVEITPDAAYTAVCWWLYFTGGDNAPAGSSVDMTGVLVELGDGSLGDYFDGDTPGVTDVDAIDVERSQPDGSWLLIASGIDTATTVTDRTPHIGDVQYRAISRTVLPTEQEGPPSTAVWVHDRDPVFVNGGDGMDQLCLARGSEATDEHSVDQELHRFAGQQRPTAFFGPGQDYTTTFTGRILPHYHLPVSSRAEWVELLLQRGLVCFRDCTGRKLFGVLTVDFSQAGNVETVSISVQEADYTEGVRRVTDYELEQRQGE